MRTPKGGGRSHLTADKDATAGLHPWGKAAVRVWEDGGGKPADTSTRNAVRAAARVLYPGGKALARIRYFETQRGLASTVVEARVAATDKPVRQAERSLPLPYAAAFAAKQSLLPPFEATVGLPIWHELGPTLIPHGQTYGEGPLSQPSVSGRCVGIDIDPTNRNHIVLCTAGGGLWETQDHGTTWRPLTDRQPTLVMGAIARAPSSPNIVYAATGEGDGQVPLGVGLLRSSDGGQNWTHVPASMLAGEAVYDIAVHPTDPLHLWVGGTSALYESTNGGATVHRVLANQTWDISINPANPNEMFAATAGGLLGSANGGQSWTAVQLSGMAAGATIDRIEVCHAPSDPAVVYVAASVAHKAKLWRRATAAGMFVAQTVPTKMDTSQAWYDWCFAVAPDDANVVVWGGIELYRATRASGKFTWHNISSRTSGDSIHPDQHHLAFDPNDANTLYACNDGGIFRSGDRGTHWESLNPGLGITEFEFLAQLESDSAWLIGGTQDNGTISNAGASRWDQIALGDGGDCASADGASPVCYHSYYGMWIEKAPAKGPDAFLWKDASPPAPKEYPALFYPPLDVLGQLVCKAGYTVFVSTDSGTTWNEIMLPTSQASDPDIASAVSIVAHDAILVGTVRGKVYRVTAGPSGWSAAQVLALASPRAGFVSDLLGAGVGSTLWASCSVIHGGHVFRSADGGHTWDNRSGNLPDIPVNALVVDPADTNAVYAGSDNGVYRSLDAGITWSDFSNGLPNVIIGDMILHETRRLLRAGTRNRGVWGVEI
ncbi:MAG: hypothetical protein ABI624_00405 [Casimicrobiaceae bacterium]